MPQNVFLSILASVLLLSNIYLATRDWLKPIVRTMNWVCAGLNLGNLIVIFIMWNQIP